MRARVGEDLEEGTVGAVQPGLPAGRYEEWVFDDPYVLGVEATRCIRYEIERRVLTLLTELRVPGSSTA